MYNSKYLEKYKKLNSFSIRYGIEPEMFNNIFIKNYKLDIDSIKLILINEWAKIDNDPIKETTGNIFIDAMNDLNRSERFIFNLCIDNYDKILISNLTKLNENQIENLYTNTLNKIKNDEKINLYISTNCIN